jgi:UDP:flavonoid glycosyltransferase YjiC (YdhE family)
MGRRILITSPEGLGHIHPMVPLARAMATRGHDLLWAVPANGVGHVERAGIRAVAAGPAGLTNLPKVLRRHPELQALSQRDRPDVMFGKVFGEAVASAMFDDVMRVATEWRPDLVVADAAEFAGHIAAAELGVPSVTKGFGPLLPERRVATIDEEVAPLWRSHALEPRPYGGSYDHLYLDIYPPDLPSASSVHIPCLQLLRPVTDDGADPSSPLPLPAAPPDAPLVYVTMGTVFNDPAPLVAVVSALSELDVRVLVTVGPRADPAALGNLPANVRVERYVAQGGVLQHCDLVVSHAGSGTVLSALTLGLPQCCLPQGADQFLNADAVAAAGTGISLMPGDADPDAIRDAVTRLLDDGSFRDAAGGVSASIASMPSPDDVAGVLETLL